MALEVCSLQELEEVTRLTVVTLFQAAYVEAFC